MGLLQSLLGRRSVPVRRAAPPAPPVPPASPAAPPAPAPSLPAPVQPLHATPFVATLPPLPPSPGAPLTRVASQVRALSPEAQAAALAACGDDALSLSARAVDALVSSPLWNALGKPGRERLCAVMGAAGRDGLLRLEELSRSKKPLLAEDVGGRTTLEHLAGMATSPLNAAFLADAGADAAFDAAAADPGDASPWFTVRDLLDLTLEHLHAPHRITQKSYGTCAATAPLRDVALLEPGQYARMVREVFGPEGRTTLPGGASLLLDPASARPRPHDARNPVEVVMQTALMQLASKTQHYDLDADRQVAEDGTPLHRGLYLHEQSRVLSQLFGTHYLRFEGKDDEARAQRRRLLELWIGRSPRPPLLLNILADGADGESRHAVSLETVREGRVFFRNPWGETKDPVGFVRPDGARVEDPVKGLYSFSLEEADTRMDGLLLSFEHMHEARRRKLLPD